MDALAALGVQPQKHSPWQQIIQVQGTPQHTDTNRWESRRKAWVSIGPCVKRAGTWNSRYNCRAGRGQPYNEEEQNLQLFAEGWLKHSVAWASKFYYDLHSTCDFSQASVICFGWKLLSKKEVNVRKLKRKNLWKYRSLLLNKGRHSWHKFQ